MSNDKDKDKKVNPKKLMPKDLDTTFSDWYLNVLKNADMSDLDYLRQMNRMSLMEELQTKDCVAYMEGTDAVISKALPTEVVTLARRNYGKYMVKLTKTDTVITLLYHNGVLMEFTLNKDQWVQTKCLWQ